MHDLDNLEMDKLLKGIDIPPCPAILSDLMRETRNPNASLAQVAQLMSKDVALSASVIKIANSPLFGLRQKVSSVLQAINVIGMQGVVNLATGEMLRSTLSKGSSLRLDRFWESTALIAQTSAKLARKLRAVSPDLAYTFGLFRDCGIPVMMKRFPEYKTTLQAANSCYDKAFTDVEDEIHSTNHAIIGYLLTRNWGLPEVVTGSVQRHHDYTIFNADCSAEDAQCRSLVAIALLAEHFVGEFTRLKDEGEWIKAQNIVTNHFGLTQQDMFDLGEDIFADLEGLRG